MGWLGIIKGLLSFAEFLMKYASDRQLLNAGQQMELADAFKQTFTRVAAANAAVADVKHDADSVLNDPDRRP